MPAGCLQTGQPLIVSSGSGLMALHINGNLTLPDLSWTIYNRYTHQYRSNQETS